MGAFPHHIKGEERIALGRKWGKRSAAKWQPTEDWHTQDLRALHDAKGQVEHDGCTYRAGKVIPWRVVRSVAGRVDQHDVIANGKLKETCGRRRVRSKYGVMI